MYLLFIYVSACQKQGPVVLTGYFLLSLGETLSTILSSLGYCGSQWFKNIIPTLIKDTFIILIVFPMHVLLLYQ